MQECLKEMSKMNGVIKLPQKKLPVTTMTYTKALLAISLPTTKSNLSES